MKEKTYPVYEIIPHTFQGEGLNMGRPASFVRLHGCPIHCPWCDSAGTWHPNWVPKDVEKLTVQQIQDRLGPAPLVVVTGGEPAVHELWELTVALKRAGKELAVETSGAFTLRGMWDHITVSPKRWAKSQSTATFMQAKEFKFIIEEPEDIAYYHSLVESLVGFIRVPVWLHPEWSKRESPMVLNCITRAVINARCDFRAGYQLHKLYGADFLKEGARDEVPLGGKE